MSGAKMLKVKSVAFADEKGPLAQTLLYPNVWQKVLNHLKLADWYRLSRVSTSFQRLVHTLTYSTGRRVNVFREFQAINPRLSIRFYIVEDNLWPRRLYRSETDGQTPLNESYRELWLILNVNHNIEALDFADSSTSVLEKRPFGYSLFALLKQLTFSHLTALSLANSIFNSVHLEELSGSLPQLKWLSVDNCTIYIAKPQIRINFDRILRKRLAGGVKLKMITSGMKWFLVIIQECFPSLETMSASETHFQSNGCIIYSYGQEDPKTVYKLQKFHHSLDVECDIDSDQSCCIS